MANEVPVVCAGYHEHDGSATYASCVVCSSGSIMTEASDDEYIHNQ
ncbi:hypothetical protein EV645_6584 [Kribbella rubisoli]|uniref:Uncharacterized protein n=1 Tax=Kribbella rubisoli TaxID=3075929 RepID=A0A4Q7WPK0_9ACTN|nr:hypothetical protein [Kribbella rubisoli]RZU11415.1 hypothetical protein EV645_6584 [Kribbella rubisoli]